MLQNKHLIIVGLDKAQLTNITVLLSKFSLKSQKTEDVDLSNDIFEDDKIINIHYIQETESLVIISKMGELFQWKPSTKGVSNQRICSKIIRLKMSEVLKMEFLPLLGVQMKKDC